MRIRVKNFRPLLIFTPAKELKLYIYIYIYSEFSVRLGRRERVQARPALTPGDSRIFQQTQITLNNFLEYNF